MSKPIRVLMLILDYYPRTGGAQQQLKMQVPYLRELGVEVHVVTRHFEDWPREELIDGIPVHRLSYTGPKALASFQFMMGALRKIREIDPDVIHAYSFLSPLRTAAIAKWLSGIPVAVKILRSGPIGDVHRLHKRGLSSYYIQAYRQLIDRFIVISSEVDEELNTMEVPAHKRIFIPNGVNLNTFAPVGAQKKVSLRQRLGMAPDQIIVLYTGRLAPEKRVDMLIQAWNRLSGDHPNIQLYILGNGPEREKLEQLSQKQIIFTGRVDNVRDYLQAADIFVLPSQVEGLSNAMLEGMAVGLPGIVTRVGGAPDVIESGKNGILIEKDDEDGLVTALKELINDPECRKTLGKHAREKIGRDYNLAVVPAQLKEMYEDLLRNR